jgi:hypothetical protein
MAKKNSNKSSAVKENLAPPKAGKGTKVAAKITVSMTEKARAASKGQSLASRSLVLTSTAETLRTRKVKNTDVPKLKALNQGLLTTLI